MYNKKRRKNSKKAIDENGNIKEEYSLTLNGVSMGLLSEKGNFMSKKTKNGMTRLRKINKTEKNRNDYIDFYKKTMGGDPSQKKEKKVKVENLVLGKGEEKKPAMGHKANHKPKMGMYKKVSMGHKPDHNPKEKLPKLNVKRLKTQTVDMRTSKQTQDEIKDDKKSDKGFPHQGLINKVTAVNGLDFSKMYDEVRKQEDIKISESIEKINSLIEANDILNNVRVLATRPNIRALKEYYVLKAIVRIHNRNEALKKSKKQETVEQKKNVRAGLVIDLQSMFGVPDVNIEALRTLFQNNGVFGATTDPIQRPLPASQLNNPPPSTNQKPQDVKQYMGNFTQPQDEGAMLGDLSKQVVKRFDVNKYYSEGKAVRQFSNKNGRQSEFKNSFKLRTKKKTEPKRKRINIF